MKLWRKAFPEKKITKKSVRALQTSRLKFCKKPFKIPTFFKYVLLLARLHSVTHMGEWKNVSKKSVSEKTDLVLRVTIAWEASRYSQSCKMMHTLSLVNHDFASKWIIFYRWISPKNESVNQKFIDESGESGGSGESAWKNLENLPNIVQAEK